MTRIVPMLASPGKDVDVSTLVGTHIFDVKLDGVRSIAYWDGYTLRLVNRSGRDHTIAYPDLVSTHPFPEGLEVIVDGEIIAQSGSFEDVSRRDRVTKPSDIERAQALYPVQFIAFDLLKQGGSTVANMEWTQRRMFLENLFTNTQHREWDVSVYSDDVGFLDVVAKQGLEGVIAKRTQSTYRAGRQKDWLKFKNTHRITAIAVGYEPGTGARRHFGAMYVALIGENNLIVPVGRVGTGFSSVDTWEMKKLIDSQQPTVVEIEASHVTKSGQLRFPVFKGIRSDLSVTDATIDQLATMPRS